MLGGNAVANLLKSDLGFGLANWRYDSFELLIPY